jgi:hypothetical protein
VIEGINVDKDVNLRATEFAEDGHHHDWRVRPNQVICDSGSMRQIQVVCAECTQGAFIERKARLTPKLDDIYTWRRWRWWD